MVSDSSTTQVDQDAVNPVWGPVPPQIELIRRVALGHQSEVWEVCRKQGGARFAWKRMRLDDGLSMKRGIGFATEAEVLHAVRSPYVVGLEHDLKNGNPRSFLLEWLTGDTLASHASTQGPKPLPTALWIGRQIAEGLRAVWESGFAHGNLNPNHVFLCADGSVRLIDFTSARYLDDRFPLRNPRAVSRTVEFMAPELGSPAVEDPLAADVYALGVLLFYVLTGRAPFTGENRADIHRMHRQTKPPSLQGHCPGLPVEGRQLIERMLSKQPLRRPRDAMALVRELMDIELQTFADHAAAA